VTSKWITSFNVVESHILCWWLVGSREALTCCWALSFCHTKLFHSRLEDQFRNMFSTQLDPGVAVPVTRLSKSTSFALPYTKACSSLDPFVDMICIYAQIWTDMLHHLSPPPLSTMPANKRPTSRFLTLMFTLVYKSRFVLELSEAKMIWVHRRTCRVALVVEQYNFNFEIAVEITLRSWLWYFFPSVELKDCL
jgi:hypothetical protein